MLIGDISFQNIFCYVVDYQASLFSSIHGLCFKDVVATSKYIHGNTLLYMAATQALAAVNRVYGSILQMQRESQWFKEVERIILPTMRVVIALWLKNYSEKVTKT
ncbi:hypothetical protein K1719_045698 [Acacia pycnantha]|nr:hypothetical protein K1719_046650 [Acacia pycnantha]KAI9072335.1 hypothetical protein K1719_045698 [Acacia pycnantha]